MPSKIKLFPLKRKLPEIKSSKKKIVKSINYNLPAGGKFSTRNDGHCWYGKLYKEKKPGVENRCFKAQNLPIFTGNIEDEIKENNEKWDKAKKLIEEDIKKLKEFKKNKKDKVKKNITKNKSENVLLKKVSRKKII